MVCSRAEQHDPLVFDGPCQCCDEIGPQASASFKQRAGNPERAFDRSVAQRFKQRQIGRIDPPQDLVVGNEEGLMQEPYKM